MLTDDIQCKLDQLGEDFDIETLDEICDEIEAHENPSNYAPSLFQLLEKYPAVDFGTPGSIVHTLERNYRNGYEELLVASLQRKPTAHTVWMLNRVLNGAGGSEKEKYAAMMERIAEDSNIDTEAQAAAREFLTRQL